MGATQIFPVLFPHFGGRSAPKTAVVTDSLTCPPDTVPLLYANLTGINRVVKMLNFSCREHQMRDSFLSAQVTF